jgi:hypothetical protein
MSPTARGHGPSVRRTAAAVLLSACATLLTGSSGLAQGVVTLEPSPPVGAPAASASPATAADPQAALLEFAACMREHGVDMPDPQFTGDGTLRMRLLGSAAALQQDPDFDAAREACMGALAGVTRDVDPASRLALEEQLLAYAACMRELGVDLPDPALGGAGPVSLPSWDASDPVALDAHEACGHLVGGPTDPQSHLRIATHRGPDDRANGPVIDE